MSVIAHLYKDTRQFKLSSSCGLSMGDLKLSDIFSWSNLKRSMRCLPAFLETHCHYFLVRRGLPIYILYFLLLCPTVEQEIHLSKTHFEISPFWRWTERNKLQFHHSTCLNEHEENKQKNMTSQHCNVHHFCFVNAYSPIQDFPSALSTNCAGTKDNRQ